MELNIEKSWLSAGLYRLSLIVVLFVSAVIFTGCVSAQKGPLVLAQVDDETITTEDLAYSINVAHRREDLSSAKELDMNDYLNKLIDERLITQEARRMGIQEYPVIKQKVKDYLIRESVLLLHKDEILDKASFTEEDVKQYYIDNYKTLTLDVVMFSSEDEALSVNEKLEGDVDIEDLSEENEGIEKLDLGVEISYHSLAPALKEGVSGLKPGETSGIVSTRGAFYIVKLKGEEDAPDDKFEELRSNVVKNLRDFKEDERSNQYVEELRAKAALNIDQNILSSLKLGVMDDQRKLWTDDERVLVEINGEELTVGAFISLLPEVVSISNESLLNNWITRKLVDQEALSRRYDLQPEFKGRLQRYENQLIQNIFSKEVILPNVKVSDELLNDYYEAHREDYLMPVSYKLSMIATDTADEADEILLNLQNGADFPWLARMRSIDVASANKGGSIGWLPITILPAPLREVIEGMQPGDITPVVEIESHYNVFLLHERTDEEAKPFDTVKRDVYKAYMTEQYKKIYRDYVEQLKAGSDVAVDEEAVESFEKNFK